MKKTSPLRWLAYSLMTAALTAAVFLQGGAYPQQWQWIALGISVAATLCALDEPKKGRLPQDRWNTVGFAIMAALLGWMILPLVPLPPPLVRYISPQRWDAVVSAAKATGRDSNAWMPLSFAPSATTERLLDVVPAMAAFAAAYKMGWWWRSQMWIAAAPIVALAWLESLLGIAQFYLIRAGGGEGAFATGTYVNRNHFAGFLEMAFPLAVMGTYSAWKKHSARLDESMGLALRVAALAGIAACLMMGIVVSSSRMGFIATLFALGVSMFLILRPNRPLKRDNDGELRPWLRRTKWVAPLALPVCLLLLIPTAELKRRFADAPSTDEVGSDTRVAIWKDTVPLIAAHKLTGTGLGTYERGLYQYKTVKPINTVDYAHNDYLQIIAELGLPGALLVAVLVVWILGRSLAVAFGNPDPQNWALSVGLLGAAVAIGAHSLTDFNLYIPANALTLAWLGGLAVNPGLRRD